MSNFQLICPEGWTDYELVDSGGYMKLERFGDYYVVRPEPQACWNPSLGSEEWEKMSHVVFTRDKQPDSGRTPEKGEWTFRKKMPERWTVSYKYQDIKLVFRLGLTGFKHVGIFPEQAVNWCYVYDRLKTSAENKKVLNLFAYTGGASLAACAAGAQVVHVDSVKQVVNWSRENMELSGLNGIRWMVEDALKFVRRELRRGNQYHGIILDPPAYGRGPEGEKWVLEEQLNDLIKCCAGLLLPEDSFLILNLYSMGFSALVAENLVNNYFDLKQAPEIGELFIPDRFAKKLPLGTFLRFAK